jgi:hypothetical protein
VSTFRPEPIPGHQHDHPTVGDSVNHELYRTTTSYQTFRQQATHPAHRGARSIDSIHRQLDIDIHNLIIDPLQHRRQRWRAARSETAAP